MLIFFKNSDIYKRCYEAAVIDFNQKDAFNTYKKTYDEFSNT